MRYYSLARFIKYIFILTIIVVFVDTINAQPGKVTKGYQQGFHQGLRYGFFKPARYDSKKSYPVIVYLHGSRDTVSRDLSWYQESIQNENPCFVITPKTTEGNQGWGNTWINKHTPAVEKTLSLLDSLIKKYNIDQNRVYLYGISMGSFGTFSLLEKEPNKFAGAYAVCGGSNIEAASRITTPLWIFHGSEDEVVPVRLSRNMYNEMIKRGNQKVRYTEYPAVKHNSWENVSQEKTLGPWLFSQKKGTSNNNIPAAPGDVIVQKLFNSTARLQWKNSPSYDDIWYHKIFRDRELIAEVDGGVNEFNDYKYNNNSGHEYYVVSVNYFFKESKPSSIVKLD